MKERTRVTRKEAREQLEQLNLACELARLIRHFFPDLIPLLREIPDPRHQSYITYSSTVLLMTRILSSIFYISSMRKTSEEFNSDKIIENIRVLCGMDTTDAQLPYWETINRYLKNVDSEELQDILCRLCSRLIRSRAFENARIYDKYWQVIIDGTQLYSTKSELDGKSMYRIHNRGTVDEYRENYYYVLEAKLVLHEKILVSIMTEFVDNENGEENGKQDCERKACWRLMERLKEKFPMLGICISADSLYACERFFKECGDRKWHYILRFKEGSIPTVASEYKKLKEIEKNYTETIVKEGKTWNDYVTDIEYNGYRINVAEYGEELEYEIKKGMKKGKKILTKKRYYYITDLSVKKKNVRELTEYGRRRWKIENEGFNTQKRQGYNLEHMYSRNYQAIKNHYYLIQIGHMISQIMEAWEKLWKGIRQSREQKHRRLLESFKEASLKEKTVELEKRFQIRFI